MIKTFLNNIIILLVIFSISRSSVLSDKYFVMSLTALLLLNFIIRRKQFDINFLYLILIWYFINILAIVFNEGGSIPYVRITSNAIVFFLYPYLILKKFGIKFWELFERWIYILTLISLPLFFMNFLFPEFFNNLYSIFHLFTNKTFQQPYWSAIVYVNAMIDKQLIRNSGFMWEPGSFAMMIIFGIAYNWITQGVKFNWRFAVYSIALVTTFSTAGYLAFAFILSGKFLKKFSVYNVIAILVFGYLFINIIFKLDFMEAKLNDYITTFNENELIYDQEYGLIKVNRFQGGYYALIETLNYPLGFGIVSNKDLTNETEIYGTNGLGSMLKMWGVLGFIYFLVLLKRFIVFNSISEIEKLLRFFIYFALLIMFFSNPVARDSFIYFIVLTPLLFKNAQLYKLNLR